MGDVVQMANVANVSYSLRDFADRVDSGELKIKHFLCSIQFEDGKVDYILVGDRIDALKAVGLLAAVQVQLLDNSS